MCVYQEEQQKRRESSVREQVEVRVKETHKFACFTFGKRLGQKFERIEV
jgi:hypothetical protein